VWYKGGAAEYLRLDKAELIDKDSALMSASWGKFQILGENYQSAGFKNVQDFVNSQNASEKDHLNAFIQFITNNKLNGVTLIEHLRNKDWASFARGYNGPGYKENKYDLKLEQAYTKYAHAMNPNISMELKRIEKNENQTLGVINVYDQQTILFSCKSLELPWKNNNQNVSCIPPGTYTVQKLIDQKFGNHFHVMNVPNRGGILIHAGNFYTQTQGCILVGDSHSDINKDGNMDVSNSRITLNKLYNLMPDKFQMNIS
jgi:hypothetical protein